MTENEVKELLKQYSMYKKFIDAQASVNKYFNLDCTQKIDEKELYEARIQSIESLMELLKPSNEYTLLYLHYVKGIAVEICAEYMYMSRSSVFRLLKKAHRQLCETINKREQKNKRTITEAEELFGILYNTINGADFDDLHEAVYKIFDVAGYRKQSELTVKLPCKVGETIYLPWEFGGVKSIACLTVTHIIFDREHNYVKTDFHTDDEAYYDKYKCGRYEFDDFGKIVFLTKEEAEAKMKGGTE